MNDLLDLMGDLGVGSTPAPSAGGGSGGGGMDLGFGDFGPGGGGAAAKPKKPLMDADKGKGMAIDGVLTRNAGKLVYEFTFRNQGAAPLSGFAIQFNKNLLGLSNAGPLQVPALAPGQTAETSLPMAFNSDKHNAAAASVNS